MSGLPVTVADTGGQATVQMSTSGRTLTVTMPGSSTSITFDHIPDDTEAQAAVTRVVSHLLPVIVTVPLAIVFDGPPNSGTDGGPRLIDVETTNGRGVKVGDWQPCRGREPWWMLLVDSLPVRVVPTTAAAPPTVADATPTGNDGRDEPLMPGMAPDRHIGQEWA